MKLARQTYRKVKVTDLKPHPRNPRKGDVAAIAESIEKNDFVGTLLVQKSSGYVLAGNHRLLAAKEAGATELPAMVVDCDDETALRILLADNAVSDKASYEDAELHALLKEIGAEAGSLEGTGWGFDDFRELERELAKLTHADVSEDDVPEPPAEPRSKLGEVYELGSHRLMCGDATDAEQVSELLAGAEPILLATDPPYGVELDMEWRDRAGFNNKGRLKDGEVGLNAAEPSYLRREGHGNTTISGDTRADWSEVFALVPSLSVAYVWHADKFSVDVGAGLRSIGFALSQLIVWDKERFVLSRTHYHSQHEIAWYARRKNSPPWRGSLDQSTIWSAPSPKMIMSGGEESVDHPTQKPTVLFERPIQNHLMPGEALYEPFAGSGTALIAAERLACRCLAMEIDPRYCDVIRDRYEAFVTARDAA